MKRNVYLAQPNYQYGQNVFLPYSVGLLQAYAEAIPAIKEAYDFKELFFLREPINDVLARLDNPKVFGLSCYIWNWHYNNSLAYAVKELWPSCLIVMGGPQVPNRSLRFFEDHQHVDLLVHNEGEEVFSEVLLEALNEHPDFTKIQGLSIRLNRMDIAVTKPSVRQANLDKLPSPYLSGVFDQLIKQHYDFHASHETHRGCPYSCTFCYGARTLVAFDNALVRFDRETLTTLTLPCDGSRIYHSIQTSRGGRVFYRGLRQCLSLEFANGCVLEVTPDHRMLVVDGEAIVEVPAKDLKVGSWVPIQIGQNSVKEQFKLSVLTKPHVYQQRTRSGGIQVKPESRQVIMPTYVDKDLAWLVGYYIGDGCIKKGKLLQFCCHDRDVEFVDATFHRIFGFKCLREKASKNSTYLKFFSNTLCRFLTEILGLGEKAPDRLSVPKSILESPVDVVVSFLDGLWVADGYRPEKQVPYLYTVSRDLADEVFSLLQWVGFPSSIEFIDSRKYSDASYNISPGWRVYWYPKEYINWNKHGSGTLACRVPYGNGSKPRARLQLENPTHGLLIDNMLYTKVRKTEYLGLRDVYDASNPPTGRIAANGIYTKQCDWGSAIFQKLRAFPLDRLVAEFEWFGRHKIELLYNADANYGILPRDVAMTEALVKVKEKYGFPKQIRAAWAKKGEDKLFPIAKMLNDAGMSKGVTLSFQSVDEATLATIKRKNIGISTFERLMHMYNEAGIPTYTELIMGLPGETYASFTAGIEKLLSAGQHDSLSIYMCAALPNSEMSDPIYVEKHAIQTRNMPILLQHRSSSSVEIPEYNDIVVETKTLSLEDWKRTYMFAWAVQSFHCLGLTQIIALVMRYMYDVPYKTFYEHLIRIAARPDPVSVLSEVYKMVTDVVDRALEGGKWDIVLPEYGDVIWPTEEATFLKCIERKEAFYNEVWEIIRPYLLDSTFLFKSQLLRYQQHVIQYPFQGKDHAFLSLYNFTTFTEAIRLGKEPILKQGKFKNYCSGIDGKEIKSEYARYVVWYGRKGGATRFKNIREEEIS